MTKNTTKNESIKNYVIWCENQGIRPQNYESLQKYMQIIRGGATC